MKNKVLKSIFALVLGALTWANGECRAQESIYVANARNLVLVAEPVGESTPAQQISQYSNDNTEGFVTLSVDREDGRYKEGDKVVLTVRSSEDGYLYLINVNPKNEATLLFPNPRNQENQIHAGTEVVFPTKKMGFSMRVQGPDFGSETIKAFVLKSPLVLSKEAASTGFHSFSDAECKEILNQITSIDSSSASKTTVVVPTAITGSVKYETSKDASEPTKPRRFFIGIGVSRFKDDSIQKLNLCVNDVEAVTEFWTKEGGVAKENCFVFKDEYATKENIRAAFEAIRKQVRPGDVVVVYISTHGHVDSNETYIVPYEGKSPEFASVDEVSKSLVSSNEFDHWILNLGAVNVLFFADVCHAGGLFANAKGFGDTEDGFFFGFKSVVAKSISQNNVFGICSSSKEELSYLSKDGSDGLSVFTKYLVEAFRAPSVRTHKDIKNYVKSKVADYVEKQYYGAPQTVVEQDPLGSGVVLRTSK